MAKTSEVNFTKLLNPHLSSIINTVNAHTRKLILFILRILRQESAFFFWLFIRFISALLPLITVYIFSLAIKLIENKASVDQVFTYIGILFTVRILDNVSRLISISRLEYHISNVTFAVHNYFLTDIKAESREQRHESIQAIRNFADATGLMLRLIRQPGIDSFVSLITIPIILLFVDFRIFILEIAYIIIYYFIDTYTTQHYRYLRDIQNTKTEVYFAKLQDSNDIDLEQKSYTRHYNRLAKWNFTEWALLQNSAVFFYALILMFLIFEVINGQKDISNLVLIMGYITSTQTYLNSFSDIKDSLTDMSIALEHLAKNKTIAVLDLDDLM